MPIILENRSCALSPLQAPLDIWTKKKYFVKNGILKKMIYVLEHQENFSSNWRTLGRESKMDEVEASLTKSCWFCHGSSTIDLLSPCLCKGTIGHVHLGCLENWLLSQPNLKTCSQCHYHYNMHTCTPNDFYSYLTT